MPIGLLTLIMNFSRENLYIGFNRVTLTHKFSPIIPKRIPKNDIIFDVTKIVKELQKNK